MHTPRPSLDELGELVDKFLRENDYNQELDIWGIEGAFDQTDAYLMFMGPLKKLTAKWIEIAGVQQTTPMTWRQDLRKINGECVLLDILRISKEAAFLEEFLHETDRSVRV